MDDKNPFEIFFCKGAVERFDLVMQFFSIRRFFKKKSFSKRFFFYKNSCFTERFSQKKLSGGPCSVCRPIAVIEMEIAKTKPER